VGSLLQFQFSIRDHVTKIRQGSHQSAPVNGNTIKKISVYNKGIALDQNGETGLGVVALEVIYVHIYKHSASKETGSYKPKRNAATIIIFSLGVQNCCL